MSPLIQVLLVEDCSIDAELLSLMLCQSRELDVSLAVVGTLHEAMSACHDKTFDVVILKMDLPDSAGLNSVTRFKESVPNIPLIALARDDDGNDAVNAIRCGAQEYLSKEFLMGQMLTRVIRHSIARQAQLLTAQKEALTDALTKVGNRRAFDFELERRLGDFRRHGIVFSVALFDVDHFKQVNDQFGHQLGDEILRTIAIHLDDETRNIDLVTRYGGEEFAVFMPATNAELAFQVTERCRARIQAKPYHYEQHAMQISLSAGIAEISDADSDISILQRADEGAVRRQTTWPQPDSLPQWFRGPQRRAADLFAHPCLTLSRLMSSVPVAFAPVAHNESPRQRNPG